MQHAKEGEKETYTGCRICKKIEDEKFWGIGKMELCHLAERVGFEPGERAKGVCCMNMEVSSDKTERPVSKEKKMLNVDISALTRKPAKRNLTRAQGASVQRQKREEALFIGPSQATRSEDTVSMSGAQRGCREEKSRTFLLTC